MKWITRERPKIDRIACAWLIKRFIDPKSTIIYAPYNKVLSQAKKLKAIPFDIPGVEYTHYKDKCTFDYFLEKHNINDPALNKLALLVRGADTDRHDLASQSSGLWAISAGMNYNITDDYELLEKGMIIYDALYSWAKFLQKERHTQGPVEDILIEVYYKYLKQQSSNKKTPKWLAELKELIQDQVDTNLTLNDISRTLDINPSYLSREFSKHFNNLSFGEYIRKMRIEKAVTLIQSSAYSLTEIAYLTGFSDQSHFTRIFKKVTGKSPSSFRKSTSISKKSTKGK